MGAAMVLGVRAVAHRDLARHGAWMTRSSALALGAGTQALLLGPWELVAGAPDPMTRAVLMGAGWALNLLVAERAIRSRRR